MRNVSDKSCRENQNTHFVFSKFFSENCAVCEVMWKYFVERGRPQMAIWRLRIACWINKSTNTHSQYGTLTAFPLQQQLHEISTMLRYTYIAYFVAAIWRILGTKQTVHIGNEFLFSWRFYRLITNIEMVQPFLSRDVLQDTACVHTSHSTQEEGKWLIQALVMFRASKERGYQNGASFLCFLLRLISLLRAKHMT